MNRGDPASGPQTTRVDSPVALNALQDKRLAARLSRAAGALMPRRSLRWQILLIAVVCLVALVVFGAVLAQESRQSVHQLRELETKLYPAQAHVLTAIHQLEFMQYEFETIATIGDEELFDSIEIRAQEFRSALRETRQLDNGYDAAVKELLRGFDQYHEFASQLSQEMLNPFSNPREMNERGRQSTINYSELVAALRAFEQERRLDFTRGISDNTERARANLRLIVGVGLFGVLLTFVLAVRLAHRIIGRIHEMVSALRRVAQEQENLSVRIDLAGEDEMTELAFWFNTFIEKMEITTREATDEILRIANTDTLSGLANRRSVMRSIDELIERAAEDGHGAGGFSIFFLDLDNFKPVNDQFGHEVGDHLIREVSSRISGTLEGFHKREGHEASPIVARIGGDEFMVVVPGAHALEVCEVLAQTLVEVVSEPYLIQEVFCEIGVSIGVSRCPQDGVLKTDLIDNADLAMYEAKKRGKNRFVFYSSEMVSEQRYLDGLERALEQSIEREELSLRCQPKFDLRSGECIGAETLLRWHSEEFGEVSPDVFIPLAEERQYVVEIDHWVLLEIMAQIREWIDSGREPLPVAVNVSARSIRQPGFSRWLLAQLETFELPGEFLGLEITETASLDEGEVVAANIAAIRAGGVAVIMDDFGAGYSSLRLLIHNKVDALKIDQGLIENIASDDKRQAIVGSVCTLASGLDIDILATGIEFEEQSRILLDLGCVLGQGEWLSSPITPDQFRKRYLDRDDTRFGVAV